MRVMEYRFPDVTTRTAMWRIYPLGDIHIGALNCAEKQLKRVIQLIKDDPYARWIGGGDYLDSVILQDQKRFDPAALPDWMLSGNPKEVRSRITDIIAAQRKRFVDIVSPIKDKCIGLVEGNHEYSIMKYHNRNLMKSLCDELGAVNLTDCAFLRLRFIRTKPKAKRERSDEVISVRLFIAHGHGGGRSEGAEPNHLARLAKDKECEVVLRGHSHTQHILPPIPRLTIPTAGALEEEAESRTIRAANWGCFVRSYASGPSTYDSRATYPARPLSTVRVNITPFRQKGTKIRPKIIIEELEMERS